MEGLAIFHGWFESSVSNWASFDTLCNRTIATYLEMYPKQVTHYT